MKTSKWPNSFYVLTLLLDLNVIFSVVFRKDSTAPLMDISENSANSLNENKFQVYNSTTLKAWILLHDESTIHRFFDSSPFSPSGRYLAVTRYNTISARESYDIATVLVIDLISGEEIFISETGAWDVQVGAHVQWGATDSQLFYNEIMMCTPENKILYPVNTKSSCAFGIMFNIFTFSKKILRCPVYHVSPDGRFTTTPNLFKIQFTQKGYGIRSDVGKANENSPRDDGLFVTDVQTGKCKLLVNLYEISKKLFTKHDIHLNGLTTLKYPSRVETGTSFYGFHVKWSPDGRHIMFIVRTLEPTVGFFNKLFEHRNRRQHMFVVRFAGFEKALQSPRFNSRLQFNTSTSILHVISWGGTADVDGNHPSWVPDPTGLQSARPCAQMLLKASPAPVRPREKHIREAEEAQSGIGNRHYRISMNLATNRSNPRSFQVVIFNITAALTSLNQTTSAFANESGQEPVVIDLLQVFPRGTGHPSFHHNSRYFITDSYVKEFKQFRSLPMGHVPLLLVDTLEQRKVELLVVQSSTNAEIASFKDTSSTFMFPAKKSRKQDLHRCDLHPAWSCDFRWIAINSRPHGFHKQVIVVYFGEDPSKYFTNHHRNGSVAKVQLE